MKVMGEKEAEDFLENKGFKVIPRILVNTKKEMIKACKKLKFPLVFKVHSVKILHKSDIEGVIVDIRTAKEAKKAYESIMKIKNAEGCLIQRFIQGDQFLVGLKKDPVFRHVLAFGTGGIYTEIIKDIALKICPVNKKEITRMIKETKSYKILKGARGKKLNIKAVENILKKVSELTKDYPNIKELDINPLIVNEKDAFIADARIIFE